MRLIVFFLLVSTSLLAQPQVNLEALRQKYPDAPAVVFSDEVLYLDVKNDKLTATREYSNYYVILNERGVGYAERSVTYIPGFFELLNFQAATYVPSGRSYKKLKVERWEDQNRISNMFFFDDVKYRQFVYPGVQIGAILELKYTYNLLDANMQFPFHFQESVPLIKGSFSLRYGENVKPLVRFFGDTLPIAQSVSVKSNITTRKWEVAGVPEWTGFPNSPSHNYNLPHLYPLVSAYQTSKGWQSGLTTIAQLYTHNYTFVKDLNKDAPAPELKRVVDSLKLTYIGDENLVQAIYYWVQDNMKYIAFEDGLGGFVPRQANDIFRKRYGDCKDMSSLLTFMYKTAGIPAYICWIGTRDLPYSYLELPLPNADNHMIAAVFQNKQWKFLDATARFLPYGYPSGFTQGKEALVSIAPDSFQVVKVPTIPSRSNVTYDSTYLLLDEDKLSGTIRVTLDGYPKYYLAEQLMLARSDKRDEMVENVLSRGSNKCQVTITDYLNLKERDQPLRISAKMDLQDYARTIDQEIYVNLNLHKKYASFKIDTAHRKAGREFEYTFIDTEVNSLKIPTGYKVSRLPSDVNFENKQFSYSIRYRQEKDKVIYRFSFSVNTLLLPQKDFVEWNKHIDKIIQAYKEVVVFKKP